MASTSEGDGKELFSDNSKQDATTATVEIDLPKDFEPGASRMSVLLSTGSCEEETLPDGEFEVLKRKSSCISEIERRVSEESDCTDTHSELRSDDSTSSIGSRSASSSDVSLQSDTIPDISQECDELNDPDWKYEKNHIFILSEAGKPIYSRHGNEDHLVTLMGVMQALVSFVQQGGDMIRSIHAGERKFVFLHRMPLILVAVSSSKASVPQLLSHLNYLYNQIVSVLTLTNLSKIFEKRSNFDLRRLLAGAEKFLDSLINMLDVDPGFLLNAVRCLQMDNSIREIIGQTLAQYCEKIKSVVFAILLVNTQLVMLVRMKKYQLHPADLHIIMNLVASSESFKSVETWLPICLPKFDSSGFLHGHISYMDAENQCCLVLLSVDNEKFFELKECRNKIVDRLEKYHCVKAISQSVTNDGYSISQLGITEVRHFLYKSRSTAQFTSPRIEPPYLGTSDWTHLFGLYRYLHHRMFKTCRPLKMLYYSGEHETVVGWHMSGFELYAVFDPMVTKSDSTNAMKKIVHWIKKEEDNLFIMNAPMI